MPRKPEPIEKRFWKYVRKSDNCWIWTGAKTHGGYGVIQEGPRGGKLVRAHRLSWRLHFGTFDDALDVCHTCDNPQCVRPDHLFVGDAKANVADMCTKGRARGGTPPGSKHHRAKLDEKAIAEIRRAYSPDGASTRKLASLYRVDRKTISLIVRRKTWTHV